MNNNMTIKEAVDAYISEIEMDKSDNTVKTYKNGVEAFLTSIEKKGITNVSMVSDINQSCFAAFLKDLRSYSPGTEALYITAVNGFLSFLAEIGAVNLEQNNLRKYLKNKSRPIEKTAPSISPDKIEKVIEYAMSIATMEYENTRMNLIAKRDAAFIITLADTGLRVNEACGLYIRNVDWYSRKAIIRGVTGNTETVRISGRAVKYMNLYLDKRTTETGTGGKPYASLPVFAAHDKRSGNKLKPISTKTGREIVNQCVAAALGPGAVGSITPSSFRNYFIAKVLKNTGSIELAKAITRTAAPAAKINYIKYNEEDTDSEYNKMFN